MNIEDIRKLCTDETIIITTHVFKRFRERGIQYIEIKDCILNGEIIEEYPDDYPYPSCLILSVGVNYKHIHVVVGFSDDNLYIVTAYYPALEKWESDYKIRRKSDGDGKAVK